MPTLKKNLDKKIKKLQEENKVAVLQPLEVIKPLTSSPVKATPKVATVARGTRDKRAEMIAINKNRIALNEVVKKNIEKYDKRDILEISKITGLSTRATRDVLANKKDFKNWRAKQMRMIDTVGLTTLKQLITIVNQGRISPYQAGLMFQMLRGQIIRSPKKGDPTTSINIGDNRKVSVYYPNFTPKDIKGVPVIDDTDD